MSDDQTKEIQRLKEIIRRARAAFCHDESDHKAAVRMLEILDEDCGSQDVLIEYQIQYQNRSGKWKCHSCFEDPDEADDRFEMMSYPGSKYRLVRREVREEVLKVKP